MFQQGNRDSTTNAALQRFLDEQDAAPADTLSTSIETFLQEEPKEEPGFLSGLRSAVQPLSRGLSRLAPIEELRKQEGLPPSAVSTPKSEDEISIAAKVVNAMNAFSGEVALPALGGTLQSIALQAQNLENVLSHVDEFLGIGPEERHAYARGETENVRPLSDYATYQWGTAIRKWAKDMFPTDPRLQNDLIATVIPQAFGQITGIALQTAITKSPTFAITTMSGQAAIDGYMDAKNGGASEAQAQTRFLAGIGLGATEALPFWHVFKKLDTTSGGLLKRALMTAVKEGEGEAVQEFLQTIGENIADILLIPDDELSFENLSRGTFTGAVAGGSAGSVLGAATQIIATALAGRRVRVPRARAQKAIDRAKARVAAAEQARETATVAPAEEIAQAEPAATEAVVEGQEQEEGEPLPEPRVTEENLFSGEFFFHSTPTRNIESIQNTGLRRGSNVGTSDQSQSFGTGEPILVFDNADAQIRPKEYNPNEGLLDSGDPKPVAILFDYSDLIFGVSQQQLEGAYIELEKALSNRSQAEIVDLIVYNQQSKLYRELTPEERKALSTYQGIQRRFDKEHIEGVKLYPSKEAHLEQFKKYGLPVYEVQVDEDANVSIVGQLYDPNTDTVFQVETPTAQEEDVATEDQQQEEAIDPEVERLREDIGLDQNNYRSYNYLNELIAGGITDDRASLLATETNAQTLVEAQLVADQRGLRELYGTISSAQGSMTDSVNLDESEGLITEDQAEARLSVAAPATGNQIADEVGGQMYSRARANADISGFHGTTTDSEIEAARQAVLALPIPFEIKQAWLDNIESIQSREAYQEETAQEQAAREAAAQQTVAPETTVEEQAAPTERPYAPEPQQAREEPTPAPQQEARQTTNPGQPGGPFFQAPTGPDVNSLDVLENLGLDKATVERLRKGFGFATADDAKPVRTWLTSLQRAIDKGLHRETAIIVQSVFANPRPLSDAEYAALLIRSAEVAVKIEQHKAAAGQLIQEGNNLAAQVEGKTAEAYEVEFDQIQRAADISGREAGIAFNMRRMHLNAYKFDLTTVLRDASIAKGGKLTAEEEAHYTKQVEKIKELEQQLEKAQKEEQDLHSIRLRKAAEKILKTEEELLSRFQQAYKTREELEREFRRLAGLDSLNSLVGLDPKAIYALGKLALAAAKELRLNLDETVAAMQNAFPELDLTPIDVFQAIISKNPDNKSRGESAAAKHVRQIKTFARLRYNINEALEGRFPPQGTKSTNPEVKRLQKRLNELRAEHFKEERESAQLRELLKKIDDIQNRLNLPDISFADLEAARAAWKDYLRLEAQYRELFALNLAKQQVKDGVYETQPKMPKRRRLPQVDLMQASLEQARDELKQMIDASKPFLPKDFRKVGVGRADSYREFMRQLFPELMSLPRVLMATADMSYLMRQGLWLSVAHPVRAARAFGGAWRAFWSEHSAYAIDNALKKNPLHAQRLHYGLFLAPLGPQAKPNEREEFFSNRIVKRIPVLRSVVRASERHMVTGLNMLRASAFDTFVQQNPGLSEDVYRAWADYVNVASGRGNLGTRPSRQRSIERTDGEGPLIVDDGDNSWGNMMRRAAYGVAQTFFAPRFAVSRFQTPAKMVQYWQHPAVRKAMAYDMAGMVSHGMVMLGLAWAAGFTVGDDPRDSDWGKIIIGNTRIDIWGGFQQPARLVAGILTRALDDRGFTGKHLPETMKGFGVRDIYDLIAQFAKFKLNPAISIPFDLLQRRNVVGEETSVVETWGWSLVPLFIQDMLDAGKYWGIGGMAAAGTAAFFGVGVSSYGDALNQGEVKFLFRDIGYRTRKPDMPSFVTPGSDWDKELQERAATDLAFKVLSEKAYIEKLAEVYGQDKAKERVQWLARNVRRDIWLSLGQEVREIPEFEL